MRNSSANRGFPAGNPIANALIIVVGTLAIAASVVLGFVAFVVLGTAMLVLAAVVGVRLWWFNRKLRKQAASGGSGRGPGGSRYRAIEGEYHVVLEERDRPKR